MKDDKKPRSEKLREMLFGELEDLSDATREQAGTVQNLLEQPPPTGQPEVAVHAGPTIESPVAQHATVDAGSAAELLLIAGVLGFQGASWVTHKVAERRR
jgi:hypothetical protein